MDSPPDPYDPSECKYLALKAPGVRYPGLRSLYPTIYKLYGNAKCSKTSGTLLVPILAAGNSKPRANISIATGITNRSNYEYRYHIPPARASSSLTLVDKQERLWRRSARLPARAARLSAEVNGKIKRATIPSCYFYLIKKRNYMESFHITLGDMIK